MKVDQADGWSIVGYGRSVTIMDPIFGHGGVVIASIGWVSYVSFYRVLSTALYFLKGLSLPRLLATTVAISPPATVGRGCDARRRGMGLLMAKMPS